MKANEEDITHALQG